MKVSYIWSQLPFILTSKSLDHSYFLHCSWNEMHRCSHQNSDLFDCSGDTMFVSCKLRKNAEKVYFVNRILVKWIPVRSLGS